MMNYEFPIMDHYEDIVARVNRAKEEWVGKCVLEHYGKSFDDTTELLNEMQNWKLVRYDLNRDVEFLCYNNEPIAVCDMTIRHEDGCDTYFKGYRNIPDEFKVLVPKLAPTQ